MSGSCWDRDFDRTQDALDDTAERMSERGRLEAGDFPEAFAQRCTHFESFCAVAAEEYKALLYRRQFVSRMREAQDIIASQYSSIHALLAECSEELLTEVSVLPEHPRLSAAVGIASVKRQGESANGDTGSYFRTPDGKLCIVLSDGMGTGPAAAEESGATVKILEELIGAGIAPATALKLFSSAMQFKNGERPSCATVDLLCTDLATGCTELYKFGAAPTYVKRGRAVTRITSRSVAAGLSPDGAAEPDRAAMSLAAGDFVIIASDGVACISDDSWIREIAAGWDEADPRGLSRAILQAAVDKYGRVDDMTVAVMHLGERGK